MRHGALTKSETSEAGMALILSLLALMLLSFLGLTLALTTSTEGQIARNYTLSRQAYFNSIAGAEAAKNELKRLRDWSEVLPLIRDPGEMDDPPENLNIGDGNSDRDWEGSDCDRGSAQGKNGVGYGIVFDPPGAEFPFDYLASWRGQSLNGEFTVWVRRQTQWDAGQGRVVDSTNNDELVMTVEGVAPYVARRNGAGGKREFAITGNVLRTTLANQAVHLMELQVGKSKTGRPCDYGQTGGGPTGSGFDCNSRLSTTGVPGGTENNVNVQ